jgi:hypothetical protein
VARDFAAGIEARLHQKDFALVIEMSQALGLALPAASVTSQQLNALVGQGWGRDDTSSLLRVLEALNGAAGGLRAPLSGSQRRDRPGFVASHNCAAALKSALPGSASASHSVRWL